MVWNVPNKIRAGDRLNIKISSYQYKDPRPIFNMGISIPGKAGIDIEMGPWSVVCVTWAYSYQCELYLLSVAAYR